MLRILLSAVASSILVALVFIYLVLPSVRESWRLQGQTEGRTEALVEVSGKLRVATKEQAATCQTLSQVFSVKTTVVHLANCNGVKSVIVQD